VSLPRQPLAGFFTLVTDRCSQRQLLLRPSTRTNPIASYGIALGPERTGVELHASAC
jgi:putative transposase